MAGNEGPGGLKLSFSSKDFWHIAVWRTGSWPFVELLLYLHGDDANLQFYVHMELSFCPIIYISPYWNSVLGRLVWTTVVKVTRMISSCTRNEVVVGNICVLLFLQPVFSYRLRPLGQKLLTTLTCAGYIPLSNSPCDFMFWVLTEFVEWSLLRYVTLLWYFQLHRQTLATGSDWEFSQSVSIANRTDCHFSFRIGVRCKVVRD